MTVLPDSADLAANRETAAHGRRRGLSAGFWAAMIFAAACLFAAATVAIVFGVFSRQTHPATRTLARSNAANTETPSSAMPGLVAQQPLPPTSGELPPTVQLAALDSRVRRLEDNNPDLAAAMAAQQQAAVEAAPGGSQSSRGVPSINDLGPQATAGLPQLNVDLHVYATDPASRFVMINGRRYQEGARLPEGVLVEHITPDGVIMNNKGTRFLLPRE